MVARTLLVATPGGFTVRIRFVVLLWLTISLPCAAWNLRTDSEGDLVYWAGPVKLVLDPVAAALLGDPRAEDAIRAAVMTYDEATPYLEVWLTVAPGKPIGYVAGALDNQNSILALVERTAAASSAASSA